MRSILRHLSPLFRSRRRVSFFITVAILFSVACALRILNSDSSSSVNIEQVTSKTLIVQTKPISSKKILWPVDAQGRSLKEDFLALDLTGFFGSGASEGARVHCSSSNSTLVWTRDSNRLDQLDFVVSHDAGAGGFPLERLQLNEEKQQYSMAFIMESEVHSSTGDGWAKFNFKMTYNLDDSYPEPATYFDVNIHILDLLRPPSVSFEEKEASADIVWIISNCNAHNGREVFVQRLMQEIKIDSYGSCLNNRQGYAARMSDNVDAYTKYKFVLAIENSNCVDYVTEKLVKAVASGSIPIVAAHNGRPDYRRFMPEHSYINIFDYSSIKELADDLKRIAANKTLYESFLWYKKHSKKISELRRSPLEVKLKHFADVIGGNATMIVDGIAGKEKSENKVCKLTRFVRQTSWKEIAAHRSTARADASQACLPNRSIVTHFDQSTSNNNETLKSR